MKTFIYVCLGIFVVFFIFEMIRKVIANKLTNKLVKCIYYNDEKKFEEIIESRFCKFWVFPYNRYFLRLSMAMVKDDKAEVKKSIEILEKQKMKRKQKEAFYQRCFSYYVTINDLKEATNYYELLKLKDNDSVEEIDIIYNTLVLKEDKYLDLCLERNESLSGNNRISNESYISQMYANRGDNKNASKYRDIVTLHLKELNSTNHN